MTLRPIKKHSFDTVYDSQKVFRLILTAMSNPVAAVSIKEYADKLYGDCPEFMAVAMTLLDNEVSFGACENRPFFDEIASLTLSRRVNVENADFVFVIDPGCMEYAITNAKCGTLADPHESATVIIRNGGEPALRLSFSGPGIDDRIDADATQTVRDAIAMRETRDFEYPQGIDFIFVSDGGGLFAIPRLARLVE